jgi:hypothetical protein
MASGGSGRRSACPIVVDAVARGAGVPNGAASCPCAGPARPRRLRAGIRRSSAAAPLPRRRVRVPRPPPRDCPGSCRCLRGRPCSGPGRPRGPARPAASRIRGPGRQRARTTAPTDGAHDRNCESRRSGTPRSNPVALASAAVFCADGRRFASCAIKGKRRTHQSRRSPSYATGVARRNRIRVRPTGCHPVALADGAGQACATTSGCRLIALTDAPRRRFAIDDWRDRFGSCIRQATCSASFRQSAARTRRAATGTEG